jgi:exonuclease III
VEKTFACNKIKNYSLYHNSTRNKRGVGILIDKNLDYNVIDSYKDPDENILGLRISVNEYVLWIVSIYGPNTNDVNFFENIRNLVIGAGTDPVVIGGDWNATVCCINSHDNIDTLYMAAPPSIFRSQKIRDISYECKLTDPFRALWPEEKDFTYIPRTGARNRSRLDFFLVSDSILNCVSKCIISDSLLSNLFDHKPISLTLGASDLNPSNSIYNSTINHSKFTDIVTISITDTYLNHAVPESANLQVFKQNTGNCINLIRDLNNLEFTIQSSSDDPDPALVAEKEALQLNFDTAMRQLPGIDVLTDLNLSADPDTFFEILTMNLKNDLLSFQGFLKKMESCSINILKKELTELKKDYLANSDRISEKERRLTGILDKKLSSKVSSLKIFENLNSEKPSPAFVALAKNKSTDKLSKIKNGDGSDFADADERNNYIYKAFEDLYRNQDSEELPDNVIELFLGPEILDSRLVQNSKLTQEEAEWLDRPLSLAELDIAAKKGKLRSAPGGDGFSNLLIIKCWPFLRTALYRYATFCNEKGILTHNFRSANIKLIPKKGGLEALKNWRPISLLSNFYKIISRAINTRLNKFVNRICSRAQKGYNNCRYTQEVLINIWEQISYCKENNIKGAAVAIDMAKAFDTLSHSFLNKVYKFFNFGPEIIKWLELLGNEREACLILDSNLKSNYFKLGRGRPQGDNISPNTFNFAVQILIFKLELDPDICKIPRRNPVCNNINSNLFSQEANRETSNNESLADDNTTLTVLEGGSLAKVKQILNDFGNISGLRCNFDKSCVLLFFAPTAAELESINNLGFKVTNSIKLLGIELTAGLNNQREIFTGIKEKIIRTATFWERFKLSLPGRIIIAKTYLVSQLNYVGCFLKPSDDVIDEIQVIINNFVKGNLNISSLRIHLPPAQGGLGMFDLKNFLKSQMCAWIGRAFRLPIDNWQYDLVSLAPNNNISLIRPCDLVAERNPILYNIVEAYRDFYCSFSKYGENYKEAYLFDNDAFLWGPHFRDPINTGTFGLRFYQENKDKIRSLKYSDCFNEDVFKGLNEFREEGLPLTLAMWMQLRTCILHSRNVLTNLNINNLQKCRSISNFLMAPIKGSRRYRLFFEREVSSLIDLSTNRSTVTFYNLVELPVPALNTLTLTNTIWALSFLSNGLREFVFKSRNNYLPLNNRLAAFDRNINPLCTFCRIRNPQNSPRESFGHLFFSCPTTDSILTHLLNTYFPWNDLDLDSRKNLIWCGYRTGSEKIQLPLLLFWEAARYSIYRYKLKRTIPNTLEVCRDALFCIKTTLYSNNQYKILINSTPELARWLPALG